jgi:hypothetical protein
VAKHILAPLRRAAVVLALAGAIVGCVSLVAETPRQRLYAAVADLKIAVAASADYCERPDASLTRCRELLALYNQAETLVTAIEVGVANGTLGNSEAADLLRILAGVLERMETSR